MCLIRYAGNSDLRTPANPAHRCVPLMRALSLVPIAVLSAICAPLILKPNHEWENPIFLVELWASLACILFTRFGFLPSILAGLIVYIFGKTF